MNDPLPGVLLCLLLVTVLPLALFSAVGFRYVVKDLASMPHKFISWSRRL